MPFGYCSLRGLNSATFLLCFPGIRNGTVTYVDPLTRMELSGIRATFNVRVEWNIPPRANQILADATAKSNCAGSGIGATDFGVDLVCSRRTYELSLMTYAEIHRKNTWINQ